MDSAEILQSLYNQNIGVSKARKCEGEQIKFQLRF